MQSPAQTNAQFQILAFVYVICEEYTLKAKVVNIVNDVGFPCQNIFNAHIKKLMVRKPEFIIETIQNPKSKHFSEIWVLLSTGSFSMFDNETIKDLINAYKISIKNKDAYKNRAFISNQTSALINLLNLLKEPSVDFITESINFSVPYILDTKPNIENFCFLLDSVIALEKKHGIEIGYTEEIIFKLRTYFQILSEKNENDKGSSNYLVTRWGSIKAKRN